MHVNNETGIIQPVKEIGDALAQRNVLFHVDATQSCGKLVDEIRSIKYNMLSFSAHKLMGPQRDRCACLKKNRYKLPPVKEHHVWRSTRTRNTTWDNPSSISCWMWYGM